MVVDCAGYERRRLAVVVVLRYVYCALLQRRTKGLIRVMELLSLMAEVRLDIWGTKEGPWKITQTSWNQGIHHEPWDSWTWTHTTHTGVSFENPSDTREDLFSFGGGKSNRNLEFEFN